MVLCGRTPDEKWFCVGGPRTQNAKPFCVGGPGSVHLCGSTYIYVFTGSTDGSSKYKMKRVFVYPSGPPPMHNDTFCIIGGPCTLYFCFAFLQLRRGPGSIDGGCLEQAHQRKHKHKHFHYFFYFSINCFAELSTKLVCLVFFKLWAHISLGQNHQVGQIEKP